MREVIASKLWGGHAGDLLDPACLEREGIKALVHVALEERLPPLSRELVYCHFPLIDGMANPKELVAIALATTAELLRAGIPTLVCCSAGMSRSLCVAAGALAIADGSEASAALALIAEDQPHDISPALWEAVTKIVLERR